MTTPLSRTRQSKASENTIQRLLWPGTSRPWKERFDLAGEGIGGLWLGECKETRECNLAWIMRTLPKAATQLRDATEGLEGVGGLFVALHQVHSPAWAIFVLRGQTFEGPYDPAAFKARWLEVPE